jgi:electron transfer flavoprotein beta subunit
LDLILIGREHGDMDDGMNAAYLAEYWDLPFVSLALHARRAEDGKLVFERISVDQDESIALSAPACASISNDKNNRLRHPLMKNVMLAKQQQFPAIAPPAPVPDTGTAIIHCEPPETSPRGQAPCRMLQGPVAEQARSLAAYLKTWSNPSDSHAN